MRTFVRCPGPDGKPRRPFRVDENWNVIYRDEEQGAARLEGTKNVGQRSGAGILTWEELDSKHSEQLEAIRHLGADKPIRLAEAPNADWNGRDVMYEQGKRDGRVLREIIGTARDFVDNYFPMRAANTIGADKYFHCKAKLRGFISR